LADGNTEVKFPTPPTIAEIKQIAKAQNATLVQYSIIYDDFKLAGKPQVQESELYIWVIKPTGEVTFRKLDLKPLWQQQNTSLETVVESILQTSPVEWNKPLKQLHQILIKPIDAELPKDPSDRVIFIPQQSLFRVPFPALQDEKGKYLIEQHTILTAPSIQVLQLTHQQRKLASGKDFLIVANPTMPSVSNKIGEPPTQLDPLPEAEKEAIEIADLFKTKAIIGKDATKVNILQQISKARIIHLATHGQVDDNQALESWIALAPSGKDNGLLTAAEIFDLKLNAELLVLSACETGRGRVTGDGVIGLSRSLIYAGVPSVIVSLWTVPDDSTKLLMTEFYKNLQQNPDKAQALRQAMLKTSQEYPRPLQWAAFTLIGEAE
jgi:CHAT domain-containing protein